MTHKPFWAKIPKIIYKIKKIRKKRSLNPELLTEEKRVFKTQSSFCSCSVKKKVFIKISFKIDEKTFKILKPMLAPDDKSIFTASHDGTILHWDIETGDIIQKFEGHCGEQITCSCLSEDGKYIYSSANCQAMTCWDTGNGMEIRTYNSRQPMGDCCAISVSQNGQLVIGGIHDLHF